jgi:hypothetical protein
VGEKMDWIWDITHHNKEGFKLPDGNIVHTVYADVTDMHKSMNSTVARDAYIKMQSQLLYNNDCACFLIEKDVNKSQNIKWTVTVDKKRISHQKIRLISPDLFSALYEIQRSNKL